MGIVSTDDEKLSGLALASGQATAQGSDIHKELAAAVESIAMTGHGIEYRSPKPMKPIAVRIAGEPEFHMLPGWEATVREVIAEPQFSIRTTFGDVPVFADATMRPAERRIVPDPLGPITEHIFELANAVYERTGRHGITRISLTPEVGLAFGIVPGTSIDVNTPVGRVEVYAERAPRFAGTFTIPEVRDGE
jgi:hypothetical protein